MLQRKATLEKNAKRCIGKVSDYGLGVTGSSDFRPRTSDFLSPTSDFRQNTIILPGIIPFTNEVLLFEKSHTSFNCNWYFSRHCNCVLPACFAGKSSEP